MALSGEATGGTALPNSCIFQLSYAIALSGRFNHELGHFLESLDGPVTSGSFEQLCCIAQGFYHVSGPGGLEALAKVVWAAARTYLARAYIAPARRVSPRSGEAGNLPLDIFSVVPKSLLSFTPRHADNEHLLWACAGCALGSRRFDVTEWEVEEMDLEALKSEMAGLDFSPEPEAPRVFAPALLGLSFEKQMGEILQAMVTERMRQEKAAGLLLKILLKLAFGTEE